MVVVVCLIDGVCHVSSEPAVLASGMAPLEVFIGWLWWPCHGTQQRWQAEAEDEHQGPPGLHPACHKAGSQHFHKGKETLLAGEVELQCLAAADQQLAATLMRRAFF